MANVCVSISMKKNIAFEELEKIKQLLKTVEPEPEIKIVESSKFKPDNSDSVVIRISTTSDTFNENLEKFRELKEKYPTAKVRFEAYQRGGGWSNTGSAEVTALANGEIPTAVGGGRYCNSTHAIYWVNEAFIISASYWNKAEYRWTGSIKFATIDFNAGYQNKIVGKFKSNDIDSPEIEVLAPELLRNLEKLKPAIRTAMRKAVCYHCRSEHKW